ncbi:MAG: DNA topoisomerase IV [Flavobacteriaceae bacterium]|nr:DNA topoisomerase IV [Flavobacteriaceae bacterium]
MKKIILFFSLLILTSCYDVERECKDFKTGKFQFDYVLDGVKKTTLFERTETMQIETYEGKTDTATVRWVNDCEFILQKLHPKNMKEKKAINIKIVSTTKNSYTFEFGIIGSDEKQKGIAIKLKS